VAEPTLTTVAALGSPTGVLFIDDLHPTERQPVLGRAVAPAPVPAPPVATPWWSEIRFPKQTIAVLAAVCVFAGAGMAAILGTSGPVHRAVSLSPPLLPVIPSTLAPSARPPATTPPPAVTQPPSSSLAPPTTAGYPRLPSTTWPSTTTRPPITAAPTTVPVPATTAPPPPVTAPPPTAAPGGPPVVVAMAPAAGGAGQSLTLTGSGFFSSSGHISITFAGVEAPGACPTRTACTVTVPALGPGPAPAGQAVPVVVTTPTGSSNAMTFTYT
jgi:hypothetical protein